MNTKDDGVNAPNLPWISGKLGYVSDSHYNRIAECVGKNPVEDARDIVKAVNLHQELVEALESVVSAFKGTEYRTQRCSEAVLLERAEELLEKVRNG